MRSVMDRTDFRPGERPRDRVGDRIVRWAPYLLLAVTMAWVAIRAARPLRDPDVWWHLRLGEDFLHQGSLAPPAHWSTFATAPWVPTQPVPEVASALVNRWFGLPGLAWMYVATVVGLVVGTYLLDRAHASPLPAAVATLFFVVTAEGALTPRPQLLSFGFLALVIWAWLRTERDLRARWWLIPLSWLWSLCHGFWFVGVGYGVLAVLAVVAGRQVSVHQSLRLAAVAVGSGAIVVLNPVGTRVLAAPFAVSQRGRYITEWQRTSWGSGPAITVLLAVVAVAAIWVWRREDVTWFKVVIALSAVFWTWYAVRTVALAGVVMSPVVASALQTVFTASSSAPPARVPRRERLGLVTGAAAVLTAVALVVPYSAARPGMVPLALDGQLDRLSAGTTVLNDYALGGWLAWRHPDLNRWADGLADAYPVRHLSDTRTVNFVEPGWEGVVRRSGATVALLDERSTLARDLEEDGWRPTGTDRGWVLLDKP
ncbi:MAG: hypothetical protein J2P22_08480 [Nocardioides sp.]|nr:hypothetical protein [Nocardioides sp.]